MLHCFLLQLKFNDSSEGWSFANKEISLEVHAEETKYMFATGEQNARQGGSLKRAVKYFSLHLHKNRQMHIYNCVTEHIQGVPGGMDKTSGECSLC